MVDAVNPKDIWAPFGAFSMAVIQGDGQIVHLKGQVSLDRHGQIVGQHDMRAQVRQVLDNIRDVLASRFLARDFAAPSSAIRQSDVAWQAADWTVGVFASLYAGFWRSLARSTRYEHASAHASVSARPLNVE